MSATLFEKLCGKSTEKVFQIEKTLIKLRALPQGDVDEVMRLTSTDDLFSKAETSKRPTLARAIVEVDNRPIDSYPDVVERLNKRKEIFPNENPAFTLKIAVEDFLGTLSPTIIDVLYKAYTELVEQDRKESEKLKKNWATESHAPSGK